MNECPRVPVSQELARSPGGGRRRESHNLFSLVLWLGTRWHRDRMFWSCVKGTQSSLQEQCGRTGFQNKMTNKQSFEGNQELFTWRWRKSFPEEEAAGKTSSSKRTWHIWNRRGLSCLESEAAGGRRQRRGRRKATNAVRKTELTQQKQIPQMCISTLPGRFVAYHCFCVIQETKYTHSAAVIYSFRIHPPDLGLNTCQVPSTVRFWQYRFKRNAWCWKHIIQYCPSHFISRKLEI